MTSFPETPSPHHGYSTNPDILLLSLFPVPSQKESLSLLTPPKRAQTLSKKSPTDSQRPVYSFRLHSPYSLSLLTFFLSTMPPYFLSISRVSTESDSTRFFTAHLKECTFSHFPKPPFPPAGHLIFLITHHQHTYPPLLSSHSSIYLHWKGLEGPTANAQFLVRMWGTKGQKVLARV